MGHWFFVQAWLTQAKTKLEPLRDILSSGKSVFGWDLVCPRRWERPGRTHTSARVLPAVFPVHIQCSWSKRQASGPVHPPRRTLGGRVRRRTGVRPPGAFAQTHIIGRPPRDSVCVCATGLQRCGRLRSLPAESSCLLGYDTALRGAFANYFRLPTFRQWSRVFHDVSSWSRRRKERERW